MITPESAARLNGATVRAIYQRIEAGDLHFAETANGLLLVCSDSLATAGASPTVKERSWVNDM